MRVLISVDIEGVAGVVHPAEINDGPRYAMACHLMTQEANAAIEGAVAAGADQVIVTDSHSQMRNLLPEELHPAAEVIAGLPRELGMVEGARLGCDAVCFIGYHARAGSALAQMDHSFSTATISELRLNKVPQMEASMNAALCGYLGFPAVFLSGDQVACDQVEGMIPGIRTVTTKVGAGRHAARSLHPSIARERIRAGMQQAIEARASVQPYRPEGPFTLEVDLILSSMADVCCLVPGVSRTAPRTVVWQGEDFFEIYRLLHALIALASAAVVR